MSSIGKGKLVTLELEDSRLITVDLDNDEDWGDIRVGIRKDADGRPVVGSETIEVGNDEDGYVSVRRCFEELEGDDFISSRWQTFGEVDKSDFAEWHVVRTLAFCDGFTLTDLKLALEDFGIDYRDIFIPDFLWGYLSDEDRKELPYVG